MPRGPGGDTIVEVRPFAAPEARGRWPCALCGALFPVSESWQVMLAGRGPSIACAACVGGIRDDGGDGPARGS